MTPHDFQAKGGPGGSAFELKERQGAQSYFTDLCALLPNSHILAYLLALNQARSTTTTGCTEHRSGGRSALQSLLFQ